ncbi:dihydrofolate reductase [Candidatus Dojkabacteria bacterium]|uniref:Dihydrofolate reductase n=1 Tax=Candidatus Dojkabacteria bacterium TaxID=2099670 RepID=A0A955RL19_9BACT|nr:dihydrofolate reductase [Candidatus Dojkabacteria bacterium]
MINIICAYTEKNRVIGNNQELPWSIPEDLKRFRKITSGHPVIMGRKSYEAVGKALPDRTNFVLTKQPDYKLEDAEVVGSLEEAIVEAIEIDDEIFIIGGGAVFEQALKGNLVNKMYLTIVKGEYDGDAFFPEFDESNWKVEDETDWMKSEKSGVEFKYKTLMRK